MRRAACVAALTGFALGGQFPDATALQPPPAAPAHPAPALPPAFALADPPVMVADPPNGAQRIILRFTGPNGAVREEEAREPILLLVVLADRRLAAAHTPIEAAAGPGLAIFMAAQRKVIAAQHGAAPAAAAGAITARASKRQDEAQAQQAWVHATSLQKLGDFEGALAIIEGLRLGEPRGQAGEIRRNWQAAHRSFLLSVLGRHEQAVAVAQAALDDAESFGVREQARWALAARLLEADRPHDALRTIDAMGNYITADWAPSRPAPTVNPHAAAAVAALRTCALHLAGRRDEAASEWRRLRAMRNSPAKDSVGPLLGASVALDTALCLGDDATAATIWLELVTARPHAPCLLLMQPEYAAAIGDPGRATLQAMRARPELAPILATQRPLPEAYRATLKAQAGNLC